MDSEYEEGVLSILQGRKGWDEELSSISEFKHHLEEADLGQEEFTSGWVFWKENERQHQQILTLLQNVASRYLFRQYLVQYWGVEKVKGQNHYLSTSNYAFCVGRDLKKGHCWYRKLCRDHVYVVDVDDDDQEQLQLIGGVGRAYRNKHPESSPDLRLYSTNEFPMRDEAARCGFRGYLALPLFDSISNTNDQCYGVLELLLVDDTTIRRLLLSSLDKALQISGFRSTHSFISISGFATRMQKKPESEIKDILELAMETVPRLYLALVWIPCKQCCVNMINSTNLRCMEITSFITSQYKMANSGHGDDVYMNEYLEACEFHHLQIDVSCLDSSVGDNLSISRNPLAHYAQMARINTSHSFAVSLQSRKYTNHFYVLQCFLQPKFRKDDAYGDYSLPLLSKTLEMNLKSFKLVSGGRLVSESQNPYEIECESTDRLNVINSYKQKLSQSTFTTNLEMVDSYCLQPSPEDSSQGWVFSINSNSLLVPAVLIKEKIENFMSNIEFDCIDEYWIIQFWAPKMVEDRCYLQALDQPYVVGCLAKGIASFRKKCMSHYYFVDEEAKEEELGPPGRVFRNGHPEISPDLFHYTTDEYPIRNYAIHCCSQFSRGYFALPIFDDEHNHKCVGVLEFIGFFHLESEYIGKALEAAKLCSVHTDLYPRFLADEQAVNTIYGREEALTELCNALELIYNIPQLYMANVWVPNRQCVTSIHSNTSCMKLTLSTNHLGSFMPTDEVYWIHVHSRKGVIGMVLASETKSCFCRNLCELSIVDQPLSHYEMSDRRDVNFAIGLQSLHTGDLVYVVEVFLYQGPATYEYLRSFLNFLLPIMKHQLKSFKIASGKELGDELVVEVIEFSDANEVDSSVSEEADVFPIKFKSVQYSEQEHQIREELQIEECNVAVEHQQQTEECNVAASNCMTSEKGKRKTGLNLSLEVLKPHFGKKLNDVAEVLGVGRSTIKRACRDYGIDRWPTKEKYKKNPSLFERESGRNSQQLSTSNLQPWDTNTESTDNLIVRKEVEKVIIKVKYGEDIIKFELCLSLGLAKLIEEVAAGLNLEIGTFKLKYLDEDGDDILLTRDVDLEHCWKSQIKMGKTFIQLFVR